MSALARPPRHYNPEPRFGLRSPATCYQCGIELAPHDNPIVDLGGGVLAKFGLCDLCLDREMDDREMYRNGWCVNCGDPFNYDDVGGYNPPCVCGLHCDRCHVAEGREIARESGDCDDGDDYQTTGGY